MNDKTSTAVSGRGVSADLLREAAAARDHRCSRGLREAMEGFLAAGGEKAWAARQLAFCDALDALAAERIEPAQALRLAQALKDDYDFSTARKILELALRDATVRPGGAAYGDGTAMKLKQKLAECVYQDEELVPRQRLRQALAILQEALRDHGPQPETLRLLGAVHKRKWRAGGRLDDLEAALAAYLKAWQRWPEEDLGYGGVNAAFLLDVSAARAREIERREAVGESASPLAALATGKARELREQMRESIPKHAPEEYKKTYWYLVTLAEVEFGLGNYADAGRHLALARQSGPADWQMRTTTQQLVSLYGYQHAGTPEAATRRKEVMQALAQLAGDWALEAMSPARTKVGLALSGGGFRASLFHLGVLARMAEMGVLRSVEALSTVSGGSIVGAHYYLKLKQRLETQADGAIGDDGYKKLVEELIDEFVRGVQKNIRMRTLTNLWANLRMVLFGDVTRSTRLGELYSRYFYRRGGKLAGGKGPIAMPELITRPSGLADNEGFNPRFSNWRRMDKVPILLLNATPLNTGHSWHFTARWMGEPPGLIGPEFDAKPRYRRLYYSQAPEKKLQKFPLGHAVAASACVPGLFDPVELRGLYADGRQAKLVDGGVHDNQGIGSLLDEGCTFILCSDASGQMGEERDPSASLPGAMMRSNSILMDRVREASFLDLDTRLENRALEGLLFVHLKKGISAPSVDWDKCQDPAESPRDPNPLPYGVDRDIQLKLAGLRTDLDAFSDVEAYSLMLSGYLMTKHEFERLDQENTGGTRDWGGFRIDAPTDARWKFLALSELIAKPASDPDPRRRELGRHLDIGAGLFFKTWRLTPWLRWATYAAGALALWFAGVYAKEHWRDSVVSLTLGESILALGVTAAAVLVPALGWINPRSEIGKYAAKAVFAVFGSVLCNLYVLMLNPLFLRRGRLRKFVK